MTSLNYSECDVKGARFFFRLGKGNDRAWIKWTLLCASLDGEDGERKKKGQEEPTLSGSWYLSPSWLERFFPRDRLSGRHAPGTFWKARSTAHNGRAPKQKPCFCRFVHLSPFHFLPTSSPSDSPGKQPCEGYARSLALDSLFTPAEKKTFHVQGLHASETGSVFRNRAVTDLRPKFITLQDQDFKLCK